MEDTLIDERPALAEPRNLLREQCERSEQALKAKKDALEQIQIQYFQQCAQIGDQLYRNLKPAFLKLDELNARAKVLNDELNS